MKAETWLPIITLVLGWAGAQVTEVFRDRRTSDRERQAHERERQIRQAELQRATLLELQDALRDLSNRTSQLRLFKESLERERVPEADKPKVQEAQRLARRRTWDARAKVTLLSSRVLDQEARMRVREFVMVSTLAVPVGDFPGKADMREVSERYVDAIERLGELVRERY